MKEKETVCPFCGATAPFIKVYLPTIVPYIIDSSGRVQHPHYDIENNIGDFVNHLTLAPAGVPSFYYCEKCHNYGDIKRNKIDKISLQRCKSKVPWNVESYEY